MIGINKIFPVLPDDGKRKKAVAEQRYFHAQFLNYGGFEKIKAAVLFSL